MRIVAIMAIVLLTCGFVPPNNARRDDGAIRRTLAHTSVRPIPNIEPLDDRREFAQQVSNRCFTPYFWCFLPGYAPVGTGCWCATPNGPVAGVVQ